MGLNTPACKSGLKAGDVLVSVNGTLVTLMTHPEVVTLIKGIEGHSLTMTVERGDHIIPSMKECFPIKSVEEYEQVWWLVISYRLNVSLVTLETIQKESIFISKLLL